MSNKASIFQIIRSKSPFISNKVSSPINSSTRFVLTALLEDKEKFLLQVDYKCSAPHYGLLKTNFDKHKPLKVTMPPLPIIHKDQAQVGSCLTTTHSWIEPQHSSTNPFTRNFKEDMQSLSCHYLVQRLLGLTICIKINLFDLPTILSKTTILDLYDKANSLYNFKGSYDFYTCDRKMSFTNMKLLHIQMLHMRNTSPCL